MKISACSISLLVMVLTQGTFAPCKASKLLMLVTSGVKSHTIFHSAIAEALAENGHEITMVVPYKSNLQSKKITQILHQDLQYFNKILGNAFNISTVQMMISMYSYVTKMCVSVLTQPDVQEAMTKDYDAIFISLFFADCFLAYIHEKKVPMIYMSPNSLITPHSEKIGLPEFPTASPHMMTPWTYPMSFWQRVVTTIIGVSSTLTTELLFNRDVEKTCREMNLWSPDTPSIDTLQASASLTIINSVRALENPVKMTPPNVIYAGGINIKDPKPLPKDLDDWLRGSGDDGFILFSLGSVVNPEQMEKDHLQSIIAVFRSLKQRIIWKWPSQDIEDLPPNVRVSPWLSQQDILTHPNIRMFITHGGLLSILEATYHKVPLLGMPVFADQKSNINHLVKEGAALKLIWSDLTEETFRDAIQEVIANQSFRAVMVQRSEMMRDWPMSPKEAVNYWTEYVIRHNGADHLRSPLTFLPWYKVYNVDVWAFIIAVMIITYGALFFFIYICFRSFLKKCVKRKQD